MTEPTALNASRLILDSVGLGLLSDVASEYLQLPGGACTVHELNGDYALRLLSSRWCQFLDVSSRQLCGPIETSEALACGNWHCHASHAEAARRAMETGALADLECRGGLRVLAAPIRTGEEIIGAVTLGHGDPPQSPTTLGALAERYGVDAALLSEGAAACRSRTGPIVEFSPRRLLSAAQLIGEIVRRKRVEAALAESEKRFADFMANLPAAAFIKDRDGRVLFANRFLRELFGWNDCVGKTAFDLLPRETAERMTADDSRVLSEGPGIIEESIRDANGEERFFDTYKFPIAVEGGHLLTAGISVESTGRKRAEQALRTSEAFLSTIIDRSPYPMWISDHEGTLVQINQSLRDLLQITAEAVVGRYNILKDNIVEEQGLMPLVRRVYEHGEPVRFEIRWDSSLLRHVRWGARVDLVLDVSIFPIRDAHGKMTNAVIQHVDITDRKRAEEALRESERRYRELLENVPMAAVMLDLDGRVSFCNDYLCASTGWTREEIVGRRFAEMAAEEASPGLLEKLIASAQETGRRSSVLEGAVRSRTGAPRWFQWSSTTLRDPANRTTGFAALGVDVTDHRVLQEQYLQAQKLESVGRLAGGVAHDFNNLLTVINGYSNLLLSRMSGNDPLRAPLEQVLKAAERATDLTSQLLAFSRKQIIQPTRLDLNALVAGSREMFERLLGEDVELITRLGPDAGNVMADPGQVHQVLMNLVVNARDAMPHGGQLVIETSHVEFDPSFTATHPEVSPGSYVLLAVTDTGVGMDEETRRHLFEPFFTTKESGRGTGLGLSTVYGIVRQSRGWVYAYSEPGRGTSLKVYLPRLGDAPQEPEHPRKPARAPQGSGTVLVVEDQEQVRALSVEILRSSGYQVLEADCGDAALHFAENYPEPIHLLLTDVIMPGMTGKELSERLRLRRPEIRVLFMSGYTEDVIMHRGVLDAGVEYIAKPFTPAGLVSRTAEVLGR
jgi:PAS domain S-box-containing protein